MIHPALQYELHRYFGGEFHGKLGLRSPLGRQLEFIASGASHDSANIGTEPDERQLEASWEIDRVEAVLRLLPQKQQKILALYYVQPTVEDRSSGLEFFGAYARVAVYLLGGDRDALIKLVRRAKKDGVVKVQVFALYGKCVRAVEEASQAYAESAAPKGKKVRPWYCEKDEGRQLDL